jgi:hypothetical protein
LIKIKIFLIYIYIYLEGLIGKYSININNLDTITLNNKFYDNVYILNPNTVEPENLKIAVFAKGYGFLKIELKDGRKIELLNK